MARCGRAFQGWRSAFTRTSTASSEASANWWRSWSAFGLSPRRVARRASSRSCSNMFHPYSCERQTTKKAEAKRALAYYIAGEKKCFHLALGKGLVLKKTLLVHNIRHGIEMLLRMLLLLCCPVTLRSC